MEITKDNFADAAISRIAGMPSPVIDVKENPVEWMAWMAYFDCIQMDWSFRYMKDMWEKGSGILGVPTANPRHFDISFNPSPGELQFYGRKESFGSQLSAEKRAEFADKMLKPMRAASASNHASHDAKTKATADALADYKAPKLSDKDREMQDRIIKAALDGRLKK